MNNREILIINKIKSAIHKSYGFIANPHLTPLHNASIILQNMPIWHYFSRPSNLEMHDMTLPETKLPKCIRTVLGLGLQFCPTPKFLNRKPSHTFARLRKDFLTKVFFSGRPQVNEEVFEPKMHFSSEWEPKEWDIPNEVLDRLQSFNRGIKNALKQRKPRIPNLLPCQLQVIDNLRAQTDVLVVNCDKKVGPAIIDTSTYIDRAFSDHLADTTVYQELTKDAAHTHHNKVYKQVRLWLKKYSTSTKTRVGIGNQELRFLRKHLTLENSKNIPVFYLTLKVHKSPWTTRPIVSCSGTLLYYLGAWVDLHLNKVATTLPYYLRNSKDLVDLLLPLNLPPGARLFISDATSMYTNIRTPEALHEIATFILQREHRFAGIPTNALAEALAIVMRNNVFQFGDTFWHQKTGAAMGTPPACNYATIFFACHEHKIIRKFKPNLMLYKRYIDDIFGIWIPTGPTTEDNLRWNAFKEAIDGFHGLKWIFSDRVKSVDYLDLTISLSPDATKIKTTLYEKELNLYLFIPPHSAHAPGVLTGLVLGNCYRIHTLCSEPTDVQALLQLFFNRLLRRGYSPFTLLPLFKRADALASNPTSRVLPESTPEERLKTELFLHMEYHPNSITSSELQTLWKSVVLRPYSKPCLSTIDNRHGHAIELKKMTIAYSRPPNLGNLLSSRNLHYSTGPPVSSYRK